MLEKYAVTKEIDDEMGVIKEKRQCCSDCSPCFDRINEVKITPLSRTLAKNDDPPADPKTVELGNFMKGSGSHALMIGTSVCSANFAVSKIFFIAAGYNETGGNWREVVGLKSSGDFADNDFFLDVKVQGNYCYLRLRRGGGAQTGTVKVKIIDIGYGDAAWTETSEAGTDAPPGYYQGTLLEARDGVLYAYGNIDMQDNKLLNLKTEDILQLLVEDFRGLTETGTCTFGVTRFTSGGVFYGLGRYVKGGANNSQGVLMAQIVLPTNFISFKANGVEITTRRNAALDAVTLTMNNGTTIIKDTTIDGSDVKPVAQDTWETFNFTPGGSYSPGDIVTLAVLADVDTDDRCFVRKLVMKYNKKGVV